MSAPKLLSSGRGIISETPTELEEPVKHESGYDLIAVDKEDSLYKKIVVNFEQSGLTVHEVEKLSSHPQWRKYFDKTNQILNRTPQDPEFQLNERYLYHGTKVAKKTLCSEGLDIRLARKGLLGKAIYFSDCPEKCVKYAQKSTSNPEGIILLLRVILGTMLEYKDGENNKELVREPEKPSSAKGWRFYDSIKGRPKNHTEFVIYESDRTLIDCIITFSVREKISSGKPQILCSATDDKDESDNSDDKDESDSSAMTSDDEDTKNETGSSDKDAENKQGSDISKSIESVPTISKGQPYNIPEGELTAREKKKHLMEITEEEDENKLDSILKTTEENLEIAVYYYFALKQEEEDKIKRQNGKPVMEIEEDDGSPIFPLMKPEYESDAWLKLNEEDKKKRTDEMLTDFLKITALEEDFQSVAVSYLITAKYNLDSALISYYVAWL